MAVNKITTRVGISGSAGFESTVRELTQKEKEFRREASRKASIANKRLKRIEEQGLTNTPSYQTWFGSGAEHFSVRGKTQDEVKSEMARIDRFLKNATSTIRGAKNHLSQIASEIGVYDSGNYESLNRELSNFFEAVSKTEQLIASSEDIATVLNYRQIWESVNEIREQFVDEQGELMIDVEELVQRTGMAIAAKHGADGIEGLQETINRLGG